MKPTDSKEDVEMAPWHRMMLLRGAGTMNRRRYQTGSLKDDGDRWAIRWREDVLDPLTGEVKRVRKWDVLSKKAFPTKRLAQRELDKRVSEVNREDYKPAPTETFKGFAKRWQETILIHHKLSSQASSRSIIRFHLVPSFGGFSLRDITSELMQAWVSQHTAESKTVRNIVTTLQTMWKTAKAWGYVQHDPFAGLRLPRKVAPNTYSFSLEESVAIIQRANEPWKTLFRIVAETGIRSGEVAGLRIEDFDPINLTLAVRQSVWNKKIQTTKSANAIRREPVSAELAAAIRSVIDGQLELARLFSSTDRAERKKGRNNPFGLIFTGKTGQPLQMIHFQNRVMSPILKELGIRAKLDALGIKKCGLHAFRRMSATQMDEMGVPLRTRQDRMGHGNIATTMTHYTKPIDAASRRFADRMGALLNPSTDGQIQ